MKWTSDKLTDPEFALKAHKWLTLFWFAAAFPICIFFSSSIPFLVFISVYAIVSGHWAAWQAVRTEILQTQDQSRIKESYITLKKFDPDVDEPEDTLREQVRKGKR